MDNALKQLEELLGTIKVTAEVLGVDRRTIERFNAEPEKIAAHNILACKHLINVFNNLDYILERYNLTKDQFLFILQSPDFPKMTAEQFTEWRERENLSLAQVGDIFGVTKNTIKNYAYGDTPIPKTVLLATEYFSSQKLPSLFLSLLNK